jgi:hypothetical protein
VRVTRDRQTWPDPDKHREQRFRQHLPRWLTSQIIGNRECRASQAKEHNGIRVVEKSTLPASSMASDDALPVSRTPYGPSTAGVAATVIPGRFKQESGVFCDQR